MLIFRVTQAMVDERTKQWIEWRDSTGGANRDLGYNSYIASIDQQIEEWEFVRAVAQNANNTIRLRWTGTLNPENEESGSAIQDQPVAWLDCLELDEVPERLLEPSTGSAFQDDRMVALEAEQLWQELDGFRDGEGRPRSAVNNGSIYVSSVFALNMQARGILHDGWVLMLARNFDLQFMPVDPPEETEYQVRWADGQGAGQMYRYPTPHNYTALRAQAEGPLKTEGGIQLQTRVTGKLRTVPSTFGASVSAPVLISLAGGTEPTFIHKWNGIMADDPHTWGGTWLRSIIGVVPRGFESFAGRYPDHSIVTWKNNLPVNESPPMSDLQLVNDYVSWNYGHLPDEENWDHWKFMSRNKPYGDCEDHALTKIQYLLELGWSIRRLQLQVGVRREYPDPGNPEEYIDIGHAWLLVDGQHVLDNDFGPVTTVSGMQGKGYTDIRTQRGLWWDAGEVRYVVNPNLAEYETSSGGEGTGLPRGKWVKAIPNQYYDFDVAVMSVQVRREDWNL